MTTPIPTDVLSPRLHLNGSGYERLASVYEEAGRSVRKAIEALSDTSPNARDYYVIDDSAHPRAVREHADRVLRLQQVLRELAAIHECIEDQQSCREAGRRR